MSFDLEEVLSEHFEYQAGRLFTSMPGIVVSANLAQQRVDVTIAIKNKYKDEQDVEYSTLLGVPLIFPASSTSAFTFPVKTGDTVLLVFCQRNLESFKAGDGKVTDAADYRMFNIQDAVAIPGLFPFNQAVNNPAKRSLDHSPEDVVMVHNIGTGAEAEVRIKPSGEISLTTANVVKVNAPSAVFSGNLDVVGLITAGVDVQSNHISLVTHTHHHDIHGETQSPTPTV